MNAVALEALRAEVEAELDRRSAAEQPVSGAVRLLALIDERIEINRWTPTLERRMVIAITRTPRDTHPKTGRGNAINPRR